MRGSSYIDLPEQIKNKQCCINVKSNDNKCFMWAVLSSLHHSDIKRDYNRVSKYRKYENNLKFDDISFSGKLDKISNFEKLNSININVFGYDEKYNILPGQISKNNHEKNFDLLLITNENNNHYCWIKNFNGLVSKQHYKNYNKFFHCKRWLHGLANNNSLEKYKKKLYCRTNKNCIA